MSANTPDQQITYPTGTDLADNPTAFIDMLGDVETRLVLKYTTEADRTARHTAPQENDLTALSTENRYETYDGTNYISTFSRSLFTNVWRTTDAAPVISSTALVSDAVLLSALPFAGTFQFEATLFHDSSTAADFKYAFTWPTFASVRWGIHSLAIGAAATTGDGQFGCAGASGTAIPVGGAGTGSANTIMSIAKGWILMGGVAGNLTLQYAQNTADATNSIFRTGSGLQVWRSA